MVKNLKGFTDRPFSYVKGRCGSAKRQRYNANEKGQVDK